MIRYRALLLAGSTALHVAAGILSIFAAPRAGGLAPLIVRLQAGEPPSVAVPERVASASPGSSRARPTGIRASGRALPVAPTEPASTRPQASWRQAVSEPASVVAEPPFAATPSREAGGRARSADPAADPLGAAREGATSAPSVLNAVTSSGSGPWGTGAPVTGARGGASPPSSVGPSSAASSASGAGGGGAGAGNGSRLALATPVEGRDGAPVEYGGYLSRFRRNVQEAVRYPLAARRRGVEGVVQLEVEIDPTGRVQSVEVAVSSSHGLLDEAAVDAVKSLAPLPLPEHLPARALKVRLPLVFRLE